MKMKAYKLLSLLLVVLALSSCKDELENGVAGKPGYLTFDLSGTQGWEDGATRSGVEAPIEMECTLEGNPIYLHTEVQATPSAVDAEAPATRGQRYTEDVFTLSSGSSKISSFGVYGRTDGGLTLFNFAEITPTTTETKDAGVAYDWNVKEDDTMFADWTSGTADFYGYAPYFNYTGNANGLTMELNGSYEPVLTYEVPADVTKQLDILTAKHLNLSKSSSGTVVKLPFDHVMSAIKFKFHTGKAVSETSKTGYTLENGVYTKAKDDGDYTWSDGANTYSITVNAVHINNVYSKGTYPVGADPYNGGRWTVDGEDTGKASFSYTHDENLSSATGAEKELNPDAEPNVFMMLPQTVPADATISLDCTFTNVATGMSSDVKTATLTAPLKKWNFDGSGNSTTQESTPMEWLPGFTYTYSISMSDIEYVFDFDTETAKEYNDVVYAGTSEEGVFIRSYKIDAKGKKTNVSWTPQYQEYESTAVGEGADNVETWKTGSNGWIHVYDKSTGSYNTEVKDTHGGANEKDVENDRLFKIEIGSIMTPIKDLSMWDHYQESRWKGRSTSNCYIVAGPGTYRIPLIYGNAWSNGVLKENTYTSTKSGDNVLSTFVNYDDQKIKSSFINVDLADRVDNACLIWEEGDGTSRTEVGGNGSNEGTVIKVNPVIDTSITHEDGYNTDNGDFKAKANYLQFEVKPDNFKYGNAVVGVRIGTTIVWSWHIWMVNPDWFLKDNKTLDVDGGGHKATYANTNIGWVDGGVPVPAKTRTGKARLVQEESGKKITIDATQVKSPGFTTYFTNVLYQWGRKDPMRGNVDTGDMNSNNGAPRGVAGVKAWSNPYSTPGATKTIGELIQDPNSIWGTSNGDLYQFSGSYFNLWAANLGKVYVTNGGTWSFFGKTIYDPSPVGYCVPPSKYLTKLSRRKFAELGASSPRPFVCNYTDGDIVIPFRSAGIRTTDGERQNRSRGYHVPELFNAANGFYHTATPYSRDEDWQLCLFFYSGVDTHNFLRGDHETAENVLPVVWNGEIVEPVEVDPATQPLTFKFEEDGALYWHDSHSATTSRTIQYSLDNGQTWNNVTSSFSGNGTKIADVHSNTTIMVKGTNPYYCRVSGSFYHYQYFYSTAEYTLSGNIMSLVTGKSDSSLKNETTLPDGSYTFCSMFYNGEDIGNKNEKLLDVDELVLPATTLRESCYESMFQGCTQLVNAPALPATAGATNCYKNMFNGCSELRTVTVMLANPSSGNYTSNWLNGVPNTNETGGGVFYYNENASWTLNSASGIPANWEAIGISN